MEVVTDSTTTIQADEVAGDILETAPLLMRALRRGLRRGSGDAVSIPQLHTMLYIRRHPGTGLSEVADFAGATLPAMSELVNRLVTGGLVERIPNDMERRRICLTLTDSGSAALDATLADARAGLRGLVAQLDEDQLRRLVHALADLRTTLSPVEDE